MRTLETLLYVVLLSLALLIVSETVLSVSRGAERLRASARLHADASLAFSRIVREIRGSTSVVDATSTFNANPGALALSGVDGSGASRTVRFSLSNSVLQIAENGVPSGALTASGTAVSLLVFRKVTTPHSVGVKIEMTLHTGVASASTTQSFYDTAVLRGS